MTHTGLAVQTCTHMAKNCINAWHAGCEVLQSLLLLTQQVHAAAPCLVFAWLAASSCAPQAQILASKQSSRFPCTTQPCQQLKTVSPERLLLHCRLSTAMRWAQG